MEEKVQMSHSAKNKSLVFFSLLLLLFFNSARNCEALEVNGVENNIEAVVDGNDFNVIMLAYKHFYKHIQHNFIENDIKKYGKDSFSAYSSNINNYNISIRKAPKGKNNFIVEFRLKLNERYFLIFGNGGATRYIVNSKLHHVSLLTRAK